MIKDVDDGDYNTKKEDYNNNSKVLLIKINWQLS